MLYLTGRTGPCPVRFFLAPMNFNSGVSLLALLRVRTRNRARIMYLSGPFRFWNHKRERHHGSELKRSRNETATAFGSQATANL